MMESFRLNRMIFICVLALSLPFPLFAEGRSWTLPELESRLSESNLEIHSIQTEQESKKVERELIEARFKPTLYARGGFISEKTMDEDRAGPVATLEGRWNVYRGGRDELARQLS
ncbi:MAG: hypothetical protein H7249_07740, partial [Chitinophagaceae bacterium]|nr:hypothetical protein [Oligoflexus sp.]